MQQVRITRFRMRPDAIEAARALVGEIEAEIMAQPGLRRCIVAMNEDGRGYVMALTDERGGLPESVDQVRMLWHRFHDHLDAVPEPEIYDVVADWSN
jgi:hypothetical protein